MKKTNLFVFCIFMLFNVYVLRASHSDSIDVIHYDVHLEITDFTNQMISGYVELTIVSKINSLNQVNLDLLEMVLDSVTLNDVKVQGIQYDDRTLQIPVVPAIGIHDTIRVAVFYFGHPQEDPGSSHWGGFKWTANSAFNLGVGFEAQPHVFGRCWIPCNDDFEDRATYDFYINVNAALNHMAVCNGELVDFQNTCSGKRLCHWRMRDEIPTYLASVAVAPYVCVTDTFNGMLGPIPIDIWVLEADTLKAKNSFINLKNVLQLYESKFGPYRWQRVGYVSVDFSSGAMEHATNIAYPRLAINGNTTYETLYAHELFHHWFGNLITCSKAEEMWINEGWATFSEFLHNETFSGYNTYLANKRAMQYDVLHYAHIEDGGYYALNNIPQSNTYGKSSYVKGALMVLNLRHFLGDSLFYTVMTDYLAHRAFQTVTSEDMRDYLVQYANPKVHDFFETYIFTPGFPHFSVDSFKVEQVGLQNRLIVYSKEKLRGRTAYSPFAQTEITALDSSWNMRTFRITLRQGYGIDTFYTDILPSCVITDLYERVNDATTDQYKIIKSAAAYTFDKCNFNASVISVSDSALVRVENNWVAPDGFKTPIPGLFISKEHYWSIQGIFNQNFVMRGRFQYIKTTTPEGGGLDNELITNSIDSLVLLYRPDRAHDWQLIPFTKTGTPYSGYLVADSIRQGEYTFGMWNWAAWNGMGQLSKPKHEIKIVPNPTTGDFSVFYAFKPETKIEVISATGQVVSALTVKQQTDHCFLSLLNSKNGIYWIRITQAADEPVLSKICINK
ncbi:MAG: T9SS type A sorting domain-containing protein [Bacteroidales bacterium]|jgi:aminopeptidase N|nr:T9SS type A sorting domain-containing protein [Bacteroidales bacterium]